MPLRYGQRLGLSFAWSARRDMGLGTDAVAVAEAIGRRRIRPWSVVRRPLFVDGRRGNGLEVRCAPTRKKVNCAIIEQC